MNQIWILKNSKDLLEYIQSRSLSSCNSIKTFDFSTLYTTILHLKLKDKLQIKGVDVLSLNNSRFGDFVDRIYPIELEIKDTTGTDTSTSYFDLTKPYDKRDDFNFPIVNFLFICSNIPAAPAYGVYISQMKRYYRACGSYQDFLNRGLLLTRKLLKQGFLWLSWSHHLEYVTVATMTWFTVMEYLCHKWPRICSTCRKHFPVLSSFTTNCRVCN